MFDFTGRLNLEKKQYQIYRRLQILLYFCAFLSSLYFAYLIIFPSAYFSFDFSNPNSLKNTVINPRNSEGSYAEHGTVSSGKKMVFDTALVGNYGNAQIELTMDKQSENPENFEVQAKKSFQAFFYPEGKPMISRDADIFKISDNYYLLSDGKLKKFLSQNAYLSQYDESAASEKDSSFLSQYLLDEDMIGYADGSLLSYGISAFIVSSGKLLPINNTVTFTAMGYDWNDVKQASADEISFYEKDKLFTISSPHPNGTIFFASDSKKSYMIENGTKRLFPSAEILKSWQKSSPVTVSEKSLTYLEKCNLSKETLSFRTYSCDIPLSNFSNLIGKDYEFYLISGKDIKIDAINVTFKKQLSWINFKTTVRDLINKIMANYGIGETAQQIQ
jgi:hypothetical protein